MYDALRHSLIAVAILTLLELAVIARILLRPHRDPASRIAWMVVVAALPLVETATFDHLRNDPGRYSRIRLWGSVGFIVAVMAGGALLGVVLYAGLLRIPLKWLFATTNALGPGGSPAWA